MAAATSFFKEGSASCPFYSRARDLHDEHHTRGRRFLEQLWLECGCFLDANAAHRAIVDMPSVFWELYVAHALRRSGIKIIEQSRTKKTQRGPDLFAESPEVWIEAAVANPGTGADALQAPPTRAVYSVPVDGFILRLRNVIQTKSEIIEGYIRDNIIQHGQAAVIAISGCMLYTHLSEQPIPRIVRALLGVGNLVVKINEDLSIRSDSSLEQSDNVQKANGVPVKTDIFRDPAYAHVSAVIYGASDWINTPYEPGKEFILIHNENAATRLPRGWLPVGDEYWLEGSALRRVHHSRAGE